MRESVTEANSVGTTRIINWYYDALNRLETEDYNDADDSNDFEHDYIYDLVGNRLERQVIAGDGNDTLYSYNDNDQLTLEFTDANTHYTYNANGSLIEEANDVATLRTFTYNYRNRLEDVNDGTNEVSYIYNPSGIRVEADVTGGTTSNTEYLVDPYNHTGYAQVFKEIGDSNTVFVLGHDVIAQANGTSDPNYFVYDGHGSVRHLANSSGTIVESYNYDAYGKAHGFTPGNAATSLLYAGEMYDSTASQYYLRARWYSPATGRFNRMDPFAGNNRVPQSLHKYLYAHCSPIMNVDPSGREYTLVGTLGTLSIGQIVFAAVALTYVASPGVRDAVEDVIEQQIKLLIALAVAVGMTLKQLLDAIKDISWTRTKTRKKEVYWHYGFAEEAPLFANGMRAGSYVTTDVYPTGWHAKWFLALYNRGPRNAVYIVWTDTDVIGPSNVVGVYDTYIPGLYLPGGGKQYTIPIGTEPGSVVGSYPIPTGSLSDVQ